VPRVLLDELDSGLRSPARGGSARCHSVPRASFAPAFISRADRPPIKRSTRLLITVVDSEGIPVPDVSASLTSPSASVETAAQEEGERLVLEKGE
jgi:hypothetical protein